MFKLLIFNISHPCPLSHYLVITSTYFHVFLNSSHVSHLSLRSIPSSHSTPLSSRLSKLYISLTERIQSLIFGLSTSCHFFGICPFAAFNKMGIIDVFYCLTVLSVPWNKHIHGSSGIALLVTCLIICKTYFQNSLMMEHSHHMWTIVPGTLYPLQHSANFSGWNLLTLSGVTYHLARHL